MRRTFSLLLLFVLIVQLISLTYAWEIERPGEDIKIRERNESGHTNGEASVGLGVDVFRYHESDDDYPLSDKVGLNLSMTANSRIGVEYAYSLTSASWIPPTQLMQRVDRSNVGDEAIIPVDIPSIPPPYSGVSAVRFYGGYGSAVYPRVYVSSNGFLSFDNSSQPSPYPFIPSSQPPNALVAAVWSDLKIDSASKLITGLYLDMFNKWYFVVIWENVLHKASNKTLTFQIAIETSPGWAGDFPYRQSTINITYYSVSSIAPSYFSYGIENQQGGKGFGGYVYGASLSDWNGKTLRLYQSSSCFLKQMTLKFADSAQSRIDIHEINNGEFLKGYNLKKNPSQPDAPDTTLMFRRALAGTATLLIGVATYGGGWIALGGIIVDTGLITWEWADYLAARQYPGRTVTVFDFEDNLQRKASASALTYDYVVDATLSLRVGWYLDTNNNQAHSLNVTAMLIYCKCTPSGPVEQPPIQTSAFLNICPDDNNNQDTADPIQIGRTYSRLYIGPYDDVDFYKVNVSPGTGFYVCASADYYYSVVPDFTISVYDPYGNPRDTSPHGYYHNLGFVADIGGEWLIKASKYGNHGYYSLIVDFLGGYGGCPTLFVWNGSQFIDEGVLNIHSELNTDIILSQTLQTTPSTQNLVYTLKLAEIAQGYNFSHSYIDQVKLYVIDDKNVIHTSFLVYANHSTYGNVWWQLLFSDDTRIETYKGDEVTLKFLSPIWIKHPKSFIFQIEGHNPYKE